MTDDEKKQKHKQQQRQYDIDNADKIRLRKQEYYLANKQKIISRQLKYHKENPEKIRSRERTYEATDAYKEKKREYRQKNSDKIRAQIKSYRQTLVPKYGNYRKAARQHGREFEITIEEYEEFFFRKPCFYCGTISDGIDRVDNAVGYILSNCIPCCRDCNFAKRKQTFEEFIDQIGRIYRNLSK